MADEITGAVQISVTNGKFKFIQQETLKVTQTTAGGGNPGSVDIGTLEEVVSFGDITSLGYVFIKNLDATNFVQWGPESAGSMVIAGKLKAGESALLRLDPTITLRMKADTAPCKVLIQALED